MHRRSANAPMQFSMEFLLLHIAYSLLLCAVVANGQAVAQPTQTLLQRLNAANLTHSIADFYPYVYDNSLPPINSIVDGGGDMYDGGNQVYITAVNHSRVWTEYNQTYNGPGYTFSSLTKHPFTAFFHIDTVTTNETYSIEVLSNLGADGRGSYSEFSGTVQIGDHVLNYRGVQVYGASDPSVCEVFFYVAQRSTNLEFSFSFPTRNTHNWQNTASLSGNATNVVFGYILLSTRSPGREIRKCELDSTMFNTLAALIDTDPEPADQVHNQIYRKTELILARFKSFDLTRRIKNFYRYVYDDTISPGNLIVDGGFNMYDNGNMVQFDVNGQCLSLVEYDVTYNRTEYTFSTISTHPFAAFFYINGSSEQNRTYSIAVGSRISSFRRTNTFSGSVSIGENVLRYTAFQYFERAAPTVCEVFYYIAQNNSGLDFTFTNVLNRESKASLTGVARDVVFGYTLLSAYLSDVGFSSGYVSQPISQNTLQATMLDLLAVVTAGNISEVTEVLQEPYVTTQTEILMTRLRSSNLTTHLNEFYEYHYDDHVLPINKIRNGGSNMFRDGNYIFFALNGEGCYVEYDRIYNGSDYSFFTLTIHPFTALLYVNTTDSEMRSYSIQVYSSLYSYQRRTFTSGSVSHKEYMLSFQCAQYVEGPYPTVGKVFFLITKGQSELDFTVTERSTGWFDAVVYGNETTFMLGYILLSNTIPGHEITLNQLEATMFDMLTTLTVGYIYPKQQIFDPSIGMELQVISNRLRSSDLIRNIKDFYYHGYDDITPPINMISSRGHTAISQGNYVYYSTNEDGRFAEYNKTYNGCDYSFTTLAAHPFLALLYTNITTNVTKRYTIEVWSNLRSSVIISSFGGSLTRGDYKLSFNGTQYYEGSYPTVCKVFFFISQKQNEFEFTISERISRYRQVIATFSGNVTYGLCGYILLSTSIPSHSITLSQVEVTMLQILTAVTDAVPEEKTLAPNIAEETGAVLDRLTASDLTRRIVDFDQYTYTYPTQQISNIPYGGGIFYDSNYVYFSANGDGGFVEYNRTYNGTDYTFSTLAIHPFTALLYTNRTEKNSTYRIEVWSRHRSFNSLSTFAGSVSNGEYTLSFEGVQYSYYTIYPAICRVFFTLARNSSEHQFTFSETISSYGRYRRSIARLDGSTDFAVLGYTLLSTSVPGSVVTQAQLKATMLDMLEVLTKEVVLTPHVVLDPGLFQNTQSVLDRIMQSHVERHFLDFEFYNYDDTNRPMKMIRNGGNNIFNGGNYVFYLANGDGGFAEYNRTYNGTDYTFTTLAVHPFTAILYTNTTERKQRMYSIAVLSRYYYSGSTRTFSGSATNEDFVLSYQGYMYFHFNALTAYKVFFFVSRRNESALEFAVRNEFVYHRSYHIHTIANLTGNTDFVVLGYTLFATTLPGHVVGQSQIDAAMRTTLAAITNSGSATSPQNLLDARIGEETKDILEKLKGLNLRRHLFDYNDFAYDDTTPPINRISNGGSNMFSDGNLVCFSANDVGGFVEYNRTYNGSDYTFSTLAIHPFIALLYTNTTEYKSTTYTIEVWSRISNYLSRTTFSGSVSNVDYMLTYRGVQYWDRYYGPSVCKVFFYIVYRNESALTFTFTEQSSSYRQSAANLQGNSTYAVLGYILLSTKIPAPAVTELQLQATMQDVLDGITTGSISTVQPPDQNVLETTLNRIHSFNLTRHLPDYHFYRYDDLTQPINSIVDGGDNMYNDGNFVHFDANGDGGVIEYNSTYSGPGYVMSTLVIHPFTALLYINTSDGNIPRNYSLGVRSRLGSYQRTSTFSQAVSLAGHVLYLEGIQYYRGFAPTVCEVFYYIAKNDSRINFSFGTRSGYYLQKTASIFTNETNIFLGYTLLSVWDRGRQITELQLRNTMLDLLSAVVNGTASSTQPTDPKIAQISEAIREGLQLSNLTANVANYYEYKYDDTVYPINHIRDGGRNMYDDGNYVYCNANGESMMVEYNKTYYGSYYSITTLPIQPFTLLFYISADAPANGNYSIEVLSRVGYYYYYYYRGAWADFSGSVANEDHTLFFKGTQTYDRYTPSVCEVFFFIGQNGSDVSFDVSIADAYYYWRDNNNVAYLNGSARHVVLGYILLSTYVPREITVDELETTMLELLNIISSTGLKEKESLTTNVVGYPGSNVILLNITRLNVTMVTRTYSIEVTGVGQTWTITAFDVEALLITNLSPEVTYTIVVSILDNGLLESSVTLTITTTKVCTLSCTNGHCISFAPSRTECVCKDGYRAQPTQPNVCLDVNECNQTPSPCPANSTCSNNDGSFACRCRSGLQLFGHQCVDSNICDQDPCNNGGACFSNSSTFSCECAEHFFGARCEYYASPCLNEPCENGGTCVDFFGSYGCTCPSNYQGSTCTEDANECDLGIFECDENSRCENTAGSYKCNCNDGYRGDGRDKCYFIRLLPYGKDEGDELLVIGDDVASPTIKASFNIPFAFRKYRDAHVISNGMISLGPDSWFVRYLYRPPYHGFAHYDVALIAPFWDDFHPSENNNGRVYYQAYDKGIATLTNKSEAVVLKVANLINEYFQRDDFEPLFVLKATWSEVVMYPEYNNRNYPSTFQAIIASDGTDTYLIYNYKEDAMLWDTRKRYYWGNRALIGYSFALGHDHVEMQGDYRPDQRNQTAGGPIGQYFYQVAEGRDNEGAARVGCLKWARRDVPWKPNVTPCPCDSFQARIDPRFTWSIDVELYVNSIRNQYNPGYYRTAIVEEWGYDEVSLYNCYQRREQLPTNTGPRCCYAVRDSVFSRLWGWVNRAPLISGPFASRHERAQIPIFERNPRWSWVSTRDEALFELQYNRSLEHDLIPRRQCCVESNDALLCNLYQAQRPPATCAGYIPRRPAFLFGDPHITTSDGVTYSFNGLGEYYMVYAPSVFVLQARTKKAKKEDMTDSDATVFAAFVAKDLSSNTSATMQFEVDFSVASGDVVIVKANGVIVSSISENETVVGEVGLSLSNGTYTANFPSSNSLSITATSFILTMQFTGNSETLQNYSLGLLGYWDGTQANDFQLRNGTTLNFETLQPQENLDILNGTLNERILFSFGQSWRLSNETESCFNYTGAANDTFESHNPASAPEPPFLEDLVASQRGTSVFEEIRVGCTTNNVISTTCLYDVLSTNRSEIGANTMAESESNAEVAQINANALPVISFAPSPHILTVDNKTTLLARINEEVTFTVEANDGDGHVVTFRLETTNSIDGIVIQNTSGVVTWTPTTAHVITNVTNETLIVIATDAVGGETLQPINVKLCPCLNNATCLQDDPVVGNENYQVVGCNCTDAYSGADCSEDRNGCLLSACFSNVTCTDVPAPGVGEICGDCPEGTTGDGRNCTNVDFCASDPCEHVCEPIYNGFNCSCHAGYELVNSTQCRDVDECVVNPCSGIRHTHCVNTEGNYSCVCNTGFAEVSGVCENVNECDNGAHNCSLLSTTCRDLPGSFVCQCLPNFRNTSMGDGTFCVDLDECAENLHNCDNQTEICVNEQPLFRCTCKTGFEKSDGACVDIKECSDPSLNNCDNTTSLCVETEGGFNCTCFAGYEMSADGSCNDIDECLDIDICPSGAPCFNFQGGYDCTCPSGYHLATNDTCRDTDECMDVNICPEGLLCFNKEGSYDCLCDMGYKMNDNNTCIDIDECLETDVCPPGSVCSNIVGNYNCTCLPGYDMAVNGTCEEVDECLNVSACSVGVNCYNYPGGYTCSCDPGYHIAADGMCGDVDECLNTTACPSESFCINTDGSYNCFCSDGYQTTADGTCTDVDECQNNSTCPERSTCTNVAGNYSCQCVEGYQFALDGTCQDVNECLNSSLCPPHSFCVNTDGSYLCKCNPGMECLLDPLLKRPFVLHTSYDSVTLSLDEDLNYMEYEVLVVDKQYTWRVVTDDAISVISDLRPHTAYTLSARVRKLKNSTYVYHDSTFSDPVYVTTEAITVAFAMHLLNETYSDDLADNTSERFLSLSYQYGRELAAELKSVVGNVTLHLLEVHIVAFRSDMGVVVASADASINTTDNSHISAGLDGSDLRRDRYSSLVTVNPRPRSPTSLRTIGTTTTSITIGYEFVSNAIAYQVKLTCRGGTRIQTVTTLSFTFAGLTPNEICSSQVKALVAAGSNVVAYSSFSVPVINSTTPAITKLEISSITETSLVLTFAPVSRATNYHVTAPGVTPVHVEKSSDNPIEVSISGLASGTSYVFTVTVVTTDATGMQRNGTAKIAGTTSDANQCLATPSVCCDGATCRSKKGGFECLCSAGYEYDYSTRRCVGICEADPNYCLNGGTCCPVHGKNPTCRCTHGFRGDRCEQLVSSKDSWKVAAGVVGSMVFLGLLYKRF